MAEEIVGATPVEKKEKGVFTSGNIYAAAVVGGPLVVGWIMGANYTALGKPKLARQAKIYGIIGTIALLIFGFLLAKENPGHSVNLGFLIDACCIAVFARLQKKDVDDYIKNGGKQRRVWPVICIIFSLLMVSLALLSVFAPDIIKNYAASKGYSVDAAQTNTDGLKLAKSGDYAGAISLFSQSIIADPQSSESYIFRGITKINLNDVAGAEADFTSALTQKHDDMHDQYAYFLRGSTYFSESKTDEAVADFTAALAAKPQNDDSKLFGKSITVPDIYFMRGFAEIAEKKFDAATADFTQLLKEKADYPDARLVLAAAEAGNRDITAACADTKLATVSENPFAPTDLMNELLSQLQTACNH